MGRNRLFDTPYFYEGLWMALERVDEVPDVANVGKDTT